MRVPWTARRANQSILKEVSPEYSLEGVMLKLKLQYFGHLKRKADSFEKTLMLGMTEGGRRRGQQRMRLLDGVINSRDMSLSKLRELDMDCSLPGFPVYQLLQTHVHRVGDAIQPSHPLLSSSPPAFNLSQSQGLFK